MNEKNAELVWKTIMNSLGEPIPLKGDRQVTFRRIRDDAIGVDGRVAPPITRRDIERALPFWPTARVTDLPDSGVRSYVWALIRFALQMPGTADRSSHLDEIRDLAFKARAAEEHLHRKIRQAASEADLSLRQIGEAAGISHQTVARIVSEGP